MWSAVNGDRLYTRAYVSSSTGYSLSRFCSLNYDGSIAAVGHDDSALMVRTTTCMMLHVFPSSPSLSLSLSLLPLSSSLSPPLSLSSSLSPPLSLLLSPLSLSSSLSLLSLLRYTILMEVISSVPVQVVVRG